MSTFQPVIFKLDGETFGMDITYVNAIEREQQIVRVPNASHNIKGIINLRGEVIPVVDLRSKFNSVNKTAPAETELVIINLETAKIALEVDGVEEIHNIDAADIVEMPVIAKGDDVDYFDKVAKVDNKLIIVINPVNLLTKEETKAVESLVESTTI